MEDKDDDDAVQKHAALTCLSIWSFLYRKKSNFLVKNSRNVLFPSLALTVVAS